MGEGVGVDSRLVIFLIYFVVGRCCCENVVYKKTSKVRKMHHCMCSIEGVGDATCAKKFYFSCASEVLIASTSA